MAFSSRYGRRYRRYRKYRRFYRRYRRGYARKYVNASSRSNVRIKCATQAILTINSGAAGAPSANSTIVGVFSRYKSDEALRTLPVLSSPLYRTYCKLYEEVKCVGMKVQLAVVSSIGGADLPSVTIYTAFDRRFGYGEPAVPGANLKNSSTYLVSTAINNSIAKIMRTCYASDLMEKAQWHDSTLTEAAGPPETASDDAYTAAALNPNFFCPAFEFAVATPTLQAATPVQIQVSFVYYMAFRNPKFGASSSLSKQVDIPAARVMDGPGDMDDNGVMMDDDDVVIVPGGDDDDVDAEDDAVSESSNQRPPSPASRAPAPVQPAGKSRLVKPRPKNV